MKDNKIEDRNKNFNKKNRQITNLRKRKDAIDDYIMQKREKIISASGASKYEIDVNDLILPNEILNRTYTNINDGIEFFKELLDSNDINYIQFGILHIRKQVVLEINPPLLEIVKNGFLNILMNKLDLYSSNEKIAYEILWIFTNLTFGMENQDHSGFFLTPKAFRIFDKIFHYNNTVLTYNLFWLFCHICLSEKLRDAILNSDLFQKIVTLLESDNVELMIMRHGIWLISTLSKGFNGEMKNVKLFERLLNLLCIYLRADDFDITADVLVALSNYSNTRNTIFLQILINRGVVSFIMTLDANSPLTLIACTLRIIGNLLSGDDYMTEEIVRYGVIALFDRLIFHCNPTIRRECSWCLSNIAAGTKTHIALLVESGVFPKLIELVKDPVADVAREALWAVCNCITGSEIDLCFKMGSLGVFDALNYTLAHHKEPNILAIALEGLFSIFNVGDILNQFNGTGNPFVDYFVNSGGVEHLDKLQDHKNEEIFTLTINIIDKFFTSRQK